MFETYFELERRPFNSVPATDQYYPAETIEAARSSLVRLIERSEGPGIVIGAVGVGKSLLCQLIAESFRHRCRTVMLPSGRLCTRRALLQVILYELGLPYRDLDEGELRLSLIDYITNVEVCPHGVVLLVDEADNLTMTLLDELRSLTNLSENGEPCVRLVLFGGARLEEKFSHPRLESFNQRIAGRFYLEPFSSEETADYIVQQFQDAGGVVDVFDREALSNIHKATGGTPRLINQLTDHALLLAMTNGCRQIDANQIEEAWADLQQLPMPMQMNPMASSADLPEDIIEFGALDDSTLDAAEQSLDDIEANIHLATDDDETSLDLRYRDDEAQNAPLSPAPLGPEVTLYFHNAHDPFGGEFDEEEVVVDRFVSPDALAQRHRRQVQTDDSQQLAASLDRALTSETAAGDATGDAIAPTILMRGTDDAPTLTDPHEVVAEDASLYVHEFEFPPAVDDEAETDPPPIKRTATSAEAEPEENSFVPFLVNDEPLVEPDPADETMSTEPESPTDDTSSVAFEPRETASADSTDASESRGRPKRNHDFRRLFSQLRNRRA